MTVAFSRFPSSGSGRSRKGYWQWAVFFELPGATLFSDGLRMARSKSVFAPFALLLLLGCPTLLSGQAVNGASTVIGTPATAPLPVRLRGLQQAFIEDKRCHSNAIAVVKKGEVLYDEAVFSECEGDRPIREDTLFAIWSMTKPITSVAAMMLMQRGAFALDDPVSHAIPALAKMRVQGSGGGTVPLERPITYRDLLRHTSGIYGYDGSFDEEGTWKQVMALKDLEELIDLLAEQPLKHQPGEGYTYGMSTAVLGRAIEVLAGQSLEAFFEKELFGPLGMVDTSFGLTAEDRKRLQPLFVKEGDQFRPGTAAEDELFYQPGSRLQLGGEGLVSTMRDYQRFCQMLVDRGRAPDGSALLSEETLALMLTDQLKGIPGFAEARSGRIMGLGFEVLVDASKDSTGAPPGVFGWGGYHSTHFWIDPENALYGLFMARRYPFAGKIKGLLQKAVYGSLEGGD